MKADKLPKALSAYEIMNKKYRTFDFEGDWMQAFGRPERQGVWFIWGQSGNGKSTFALMLAQYLSKWDKVLINELEEGGLTTKEAWKRTGLSGSKKVLMVQDGLAELSARLSKRKSPAVVVVNSFQYLFKNYSEYEALTRSFPKKLFIIVSQSDGKKPLGRPALSAQFDASLKIWVEGYKAFSKGRYIGPNGGEFTIWKEGAYKYFGTF